MNEELKKKMLAFKDKQIKNQTCTCDLCGEENEILIEKPLSTVIKGEFFTHSRPKPLWICLECLTVELENW